MSLDASDPPVSPSPADLPAGQTPPESVPVDEVAPPARRPRPPGWQSPGLRRGAEKKRVQGRMRAEAVRDCWLRGLSVGETAEAVGVTARQVTRWRAWWRRWAASDPSEAERAVVRATLRVGLRRMFDSGVDRFVADPGSSGPAGAVALKAAESLGSLYGLAPGEGGDDARAAFAEIAASVRSRAGLLSAAPRGGGTATCGGVDPPAPPVTGESA